MANEIKLINDISKIDAGILKAIRKIYVAELVKRTPKKTGFTSNDWDAASLGNFNYMIYNPRGDIILFLDQGTKPHTIRPKNKKMLRFPIEQAPTMRNAADTKRLAREGEIWFRNAAGIPVLGYKREGSRWFCFARKVNHPGFEGEFFLEDVMNSETLFTEFKTEVVKAITA
jgi:hypothetical protein